MGRRVSALTLSLIIVSMALSGCISSKENSSDNVVDEDSDLVLPYFEKDDYRCFEHDDYERCWITYVPEKVNGSELVPLIIDLHGWSLSAFEQRDISGFDEIAEEYGAILLNPEGLALGGDPATGGSEESWNAGWC